MEHQDNKSWEAIWKFLRGDMPTEEFESWIYAEPSLETPLGSALYLQAISTDFRSMDEVAKLRATLNCIARTACARHCECVTLPNTAVVDMGEHELVFATLQRAHVRGQPYWWLSIDLCKSCGQAWLVAAEERQNDVFCMRRLAPSQVEGVRVNNDWPTDFDSYETLLRIGLQANRAVSFVDPLGDSSLASIITDLAQARPGIRVSELAALLNLQPDIARTLSAMVAKEKGLRIEFDLD